MKNKYLVAVSYQVEVESDREQGAISEAAYASLYSVPVRNLSMRIVSSAPLISLPESLTGVEPIPEL